MRVMVIVKATQSSEAGEIPSEELMAEMGRFNDELIAAGIMKAGEGLKPSSAGARIRFSGKDRTLTDGPFPETKELIAGYWLWEVSSLEEAIDWVKRCPNPMQEDSDIEIRPLYKMEDFAAMDATGEFAKQDKSQRAAVSMQDADIQPYLFFGGRCEEALEYYKEALNAKVGTVLLHSDSPEPAPEGMLPEGFEKKVMHAEFTVGKVKLMASDGCGEAIEPGGFSLALTVPSEADVNRVFAALADGGKTVMPLGKTFWSPLFGVVTDKFGVSWMVMVPDPKT